MTASTIATRLSFRAHLQTLMVLGNLGGAVLTFLYFHYVDPMAVSGGVATTGAEIAYFVVAFGLLSVIGRRLAKRWLAPLRGRAPCYRLAWPATLRAGARCCCRHSWRWRAVGAG